MACIRSFTGQHALPENGPDKSRPGIGLQRRFEERSDEVVGCFTIQEIYDQAIQHHTGTIPKRDWESAASQNVLVVQKDAREAGFPGGQANEELWI